MRSLLGVPLLALALVAAGAVPAQAAVPVQRISQDPYAAPPGQHQTEVEPDSYSFSSTVVMVTQVGRIFDGGATNIGFSTSVDNGAT